MDDHDDIDQLPTGTVRNTLLAETQSWVASSYHGQDINASAHEALFTVLGIPLDANPVVPRMFHPDRYRLAAEAFTEILQLGLVHENSGGAEPGTHEAHIANESWHILMDARRQPDLDAQQNALTHIQAMLDGLEHWLLYTTDGLCASMTDLAAMMGFGVKA